MRAKRCPTRRSWKPGSPWGRKQGYEYEKDRYVVFTDEELERLPVDSLRTIDVEAFVDPDQVDPLSVEGGYYLAPQKSAVKAYRLLAEAMEKAG